MLMISRWHQQSSVGGTTPDTNLIQSGEIPLAQDLLMIKLNAISAQNTCKSVRASPG